MGVSLTKGQKISLEKESGSGLSKVIMGLGWDPVGGFFDKILKLFGSSGGNIDLDASCALFDANKTPIDFIWFRQLQSRDGSIVHTGDNLTGEGGEGDDEQIIVELSKVPPAIKHLVFTVNSFQGQTFNQVKNAYCRLVDESNNKEIARYTLSGGGNHTAMVMAKLYRQDGDWKMEALGTPSTGRVIEDLIPAMIASL
jgi:tellurium resistance protein TerZ